MSTAPITIAPDQAQSENSSENQGPRVVVVGAGIAGLTSALALRLRGARVTLVTTGLGGLQLSQGTIDILGSLDGQKVERPVEAFDRLPDDHPYRVIGADAVREGVRLFNEQLGELALVGDVETNSVYPTAIGAMRPTALVPRSMVAGRLEAGQKLLIVGVHELKDFHPELIAGNLVRGQSVPVEARHASFSLPAREHEVDASPVTYARAMDRPEFRARFIAELKKIVQPAEIVGVPAVLGLDDPAVHAEVEKALGTSVFEIVSQPPSVSGMRMNQALLRQAKAIGVRVVLGATVTGLEAEGSRATGVSVEVAGRERVFPCDAVVHCAGGFESGTLAVDSYNQVSETVFGLPVTATDATELIHGDYWGKPQPLFAVGVRVDDQMRVVDHAGTPVYDNLYAAGGIIAGSIRWSEKSGEGIALGSAVKAATSITEGVDR